MGHPGKRAYNCLIERLLQGWSSSGGGSGVDRWAMADPLRFPGSQPPAYIGAGGVLAAVTGGRRAVDRDEN